MNTVVDHVPPLIALAALSRLLLQEIDRADDEQLAPRQLRADLDAFAARVESDLDVVSHRGRLRLADESDLVDEN